MAVIAEGCASSPESSDVPGPESPMRGSGGADEFAPNAEVPLPALPERRPDPRILRRLSASSEGPRAGFAHAGPALSLAPSPDGSRLATAGGDGTVRVWDARTGREVSVLVRAEGTVRAIRYSGDGRLLAVGGDDRRIEVFDAGSGKRVRCFEDIPASVVRIWLPEFDGSVVCAILSDGTGVSIEPNGKVVLLEEGWSGAPIQAEATTPSTPSSHRESAMAMKGGGIRIERREFRECGMETESGVRRIPEAHAGRITGLERIPESLVLLSAGTDGAIRSWNLQSLERVGEVVDGGAGVTALALSPDHLVLWAAKSDGTVLGYDVKAFLPATMEK